MPTEFSFRGIGHVDEVARYGRSVFIGATLAAGYGAVTLGSMSDLALTADTATSTLPVIGAAVSVSDFVVFAPIGFLIIYLYFHLYLQRLWDALVKLPAIFPDGRTIAETSLPWLLIGMTSAFMPMLKSSSRGILTKVEWMVSTFAGWILLPALLLLFWASAFSMRNAGAQWLITVCLIAIVYFGTSSFARMRLTLSGRLRGTANGHPRISRSPEVIGAQVVCLVVVGLTGYGMHCWSPDQLSKGVMDAVSLRPYARLQRSFLSVPPAIWSGEDKELPGVRGARLSGRNLRYAELSGAFLARADLEGSDLRDADLRRSDLRQASFKGANLTGAKITLAIARDANFTGAVLRNVDFRTTDVRGATFYMADLRGTNFRAAVNLATQQFTNPEAVSDVDPDRPIICTDGSTKWPEEWDRIRESSPGANPTPEVEKILWVMTGGNDCPD